MMDSILPIAVLLAVADWIAAVTLHLADRRASSVALHERAVTATFLALAATGVVVVFLNRALGRPLSEDLLGAITLAIVVLISAPALYWLALLVAGRFDRGG